MRLRRRDGGLTGGQRKREQVSSRDGGERSKSERSDRQTGAEPNDRPHRSVDMSVGCKVGISVYRSVGRSISTIFCLCWLFSPNFDLIPMTSLKGVSGAGISFAYLSSTYLHIN